MEIPIGYFFATAYFSFATGALGVFIVMQILQLFGWADWFGKNKSTSYERKIADAKSVEELLQIVGTMPVIYGDGVEGARREYRTQAIQNLIKAVDYNVDPRARSLRRDATPEQKREWDLQQGLGNILETEGKYRADPFSLIPNKDVREKLKQLEANKKRKTQEADKYANNRSK